MACPICYPGSNAIPGPPCVRAKHTRCQDCLRANRICARCLDAVGVAIRGVIERQQGRRPRSMPMTSADVAMQREAAQARYEAHVAAQREETVRYLSQECGYIAPEPRRQTLWARRLRLLEHLVEGTSAFVSLSDAESVAVAHEVEKIRGAPSATEAWQFVVWPTASGVDVGQWSRVTMATPGRRLYKISLIRRDTSSAWPTVAPWQPPPFQDRRRREWALPSMDVPRGWTWLQDCDAPPPGYGAGGGWRETRRAVLMQDRWTPARSRAGSAHAVRQGEAANRRSAWWQQANADRAAREIAQREIAQEHARALQAAAQREAEEEVLIERLRAAALARG